MRLRLPERAADKDVIDVEYRRSAAWAQLECHYGIAIMTHYRACRTPDLTGEVTPVRSRRHRFQFLPRLQIQTMSRNKGSAWVKFITPKAGVRIRILPSRLGGPGNASAAISQLDFLVLTITLVFAASFVPIFCFVQGRNFFKASI